MEEVLESVFRRAPVFHELLKSTASAPALSDGRFPSRNFLLESHIPTERVEDYLRRPDLPGLSGNARDDLDALSFFQNLYAVEQLRAGVRSDTFDLADPNCPDTFRVGRSLAEFGESDDNLTLVRLEDISFIASLAGVTEQNMYDTLSEAAEHVRRGDKGAANTSGCTPLLRRWQDSVDNRPLFAAFWDDAKSVLEDPQPGWAQELRDRLGLAHYDPKLRKRGAGIGVVAFCYPVRLIPRAGTGRERLLVRPTVLDGSLSEAFYTAPPESGAGATVDLEIRDDSPWQEVVHPAVEFRAEHTWAIDTILTPPGEKLEAARGHHALKVCSTSSPDFLGMCQEVDGDLI